MIPTARKIPPETGSALSPTEPPHHPVKKSAKKRIRNFTADDRAAHRAFEKGRREAFKERLKELAAELPALEDTDPRRLSKHVVVEESIARHKLLRSRCLVALQSIQDLIEERDELLAEVNTWREGAGGVPRVPRMVEVPGGLVEMEQETIASFEHVGEQSAGDGQEGYDSPGYEEGGGIDGQQQDGPAALAVPEQPMLAALNTIIHESGEDPTNEWIAPGLGGPLLKSREVPAHGHMDAVHLMGQNLLLPAGAVGGQPPAQIPRAGSYHHLLGDLALGQSTDYVDIGPLGGFPPPGVGPANHPNLMHFAAPPLSNQQPHITPLGQQSQQQNQQWATWFPQ